MYPLFISTCVYRNMHTNLSPGTDALSFHVLHIANRAGPSRQYLTSTGDMLAPRSTSWTSSSSSFSGPRQSTGRNPHSRENNWLFHRQCHCQRLPGTPTPALHTNTNNESFDGITLETIVTLNHRDFHSSTQISAHQHGFQLITCSRES